MRILEKPRVLFGIVSGCRCHVVVVVWVLVSLDLPRDGLGPDPEHDVPSEAAVVLAVITFELDLLVRLVTGKKECTIIRRSFDFRDSTE